MTKMIHPAWLRIMTKKLANMNKEQAVKWMKKETDVTQVDEDHYEVKSLNSDHEHYKQWNMFDQKGMVGMHSLILPLPSASLVKKP